MLVRRVRLALALLGVVGLVAVPAAVLASASGDSHPRALALARQPAGATRPVAGHSLASTPRATAQGRSGSVKALVIAGAVIAGAVVGLVPATLLAMATGVVRRPRRVRRARRRAPARRRSRARRVRRVAAAVASPAPPPPAPTASPAPAPPAPASPEP